MKTTSTTFLMTIITIFSLIVFIICSFMAYSLITQKTEGYSFLMGIMLAAAIPFFIGVYNTLKLLKYINQQKIFSGESIKSLKIIKNCAFSISAIYGLSLPYIFFNAEQDDAPGLALMGLTFFFAPLVIAMFSAVFQKELQNAIKIKTENDLTV